MYINQTKVRSMRWLRKHRHVKIGTTNGCFDLLHPGHIDFLRECAKRVGKGNLLVVLVNDDEWCRRNKGQTRPVIDQAGRVESVAAIKGVGLAFLFKEQTPVDWIKKIKPDVHFKGADWLGIEILESKYAPIEYIPLKEGYSTTKLTERIANGVSGWKNDEPCNGRV